MMRYLYFPICIHSYPSLMFYRLCYIIKITNGLRLLIFYLFSMFSFFQVGYDEIIYLIIMATR